MAALCRQKMFAVRPAESDKQLVRRRDGYLVVNTAWEGWTQLPSDQEILDLYMAANKHHSTADIGAPFEHTPKPVDEYRDVMERYHVSEKIIDTLEHDVIRDVFTMEQAVILREMSMDAYAPENHARWRQEPLASVSFYQMTRLAKLEDWSDYCLTHPDPKVRELAITHCDNLEIIYEVALKETDPAVIRHMVKQILGSSSTWRKGLALIAEKTAGIERGPYGVYLHELTRGLHDYLFAGRELPDYIGLSGMDGWHMEQPDDLNLTIHCHH